MKIVSAKKSQGFLLLAAGVLLVVGSVVLLLASHMISTDTYVSSNENQTVEALYVATAGLQKATYSLTTTVPADLAVCDDITGNVEFTNVAFSDGYFTVLATEVLNSAASLTDNISSAATVIPVSTLSNYGNLGQVEIGNEVVQYAGTSESVAACLGNQPCLLNAVRGAEGSSAAAHSASDTVTQNKCHLVSIGSVPNAVNPEGERVLSQDVYLASGNDVGAGWIVGEKAGSNQNSFEYILQLSNSAWTALDGSDALPDVHLFGVYAIDENSAWAVGDKNGGRTTVFQWNGTSWVRATTTGTPNAKLTGVHCADADNCWAVGDSKTFIHWNGTNWSSGNLNSSVPNKGFNDVYCLSADSCWAVGQNDLSDLLIVYWDGAVWSRATAVSGFAINKALNAITCTASNDCWAVGDSATFVHWDGSVWSVGSTNSNVPSKSISSVSCTASNDCWAVGVKSGDALMVHWNGSEWSRVTPDSGVSSKDLYAVDCVNANNCWASGQSGTIVQWNGLNWVNYSATATENKDLNGISLYSSNSGGSSSMFVTNWHEEQNTG